jgi:hypothetical protein
MAGSHGLRPDSTRPIIARHSRCGPRDQGGSGLAALKPQLTGGTARPTRLRPRGRTRLHIRGPHGVPE